MLEERLRTVLRNAISRYDYPAVVFDFQRDREVKMESMRDVECYIRLQLISKNLDEVHEGLCNVLYWGFYTFPPRFRDRRVKDYCQRVTSEHLQKAGDLFVGLRGTGLRAIKSLGVPQFGMMPFVSKIRMFLDPCQFVILDNKLLKIRNAYRHTLFHDIKKGAKEDDHSHKSA